MTAHTPFYISHTIQLGRGEVLEALRGAALARAKESLRLVDPSARGVEMETRILSGSVVEIDGAAVVIEAQLPADLAALLQTVQPTVPKADQPAPVVAEDALLIA
ncbi:methionyl-tRNA synthetase [Pseudoroseomonas globiformis]|uniref:Methionyl-tRNA synthetase n=1 Tax=Teichococcus globiformis TaxID=2307229 RepID=A0ABV7G3U1_9PROT